MKQRIGIWGSAWLVGAAVLAVAGSAGAVDLGVEGPTYQILEPSFMITLAKRLDGVDWSAVEAKKADDVKDHLRHLPDDGLSTASETRTRYMDPSVVLDREVRAPQRQADGSVKWVVLGQKGDRINPLDRVRPLTRMLVFNPDQPAQRAFALAAKKAYPTLVELLVSSGDPDKIAKEIGAPVYYAGSKVVARFGLEHAPCLIGPGEGGNAKMIAVTEFGPSDLRADEAGALVKKSWYGLNVNSRGAGH